MSNLIKELRIGTDQTEPAFYTKEFSSAFGPYLSIDWKMDEIVFKYRSEPMPDLNDRQGPFFAYIRLTMPGFQHLASVMAFALHLPKYFKKQNIFHYRSLMEFSASEDLEGLKQQLQAGLLTQGFVPGIYNGQWAASLSDQVDATLTSLLDKYVLTSETELSRYDKMALACCHLKKHQGTIAIPLSPDPALIPELFESYDAIVLNVHLFEKLRTYVSNTYQPSWTSRFFPFFRWANRHHNHLEPDSTRTVCAPQGLFTLPSGPFVFSQPLKALATLYAPEEIMRATGSITMLEGRSRGLSSQRLDRLKNDLAVLILSIAAHTPIEQISYHVKESKTLKIKVDGQGKLIINHGEYSLIKGKLPFESSVNITAGAFQLLKYLHKNDIQSLEVEPHELSSHQ